MARGFPHEYKYIDENILLNRQIFPLTRFFYRWPAKSKHAWMGRVWDLLGIIAFIERHVRVGYLLCAGAFLSCLLWSQKIWGIYIILQMIGSPIGVFSRVSLWGNTEVKVGLVCPKTIFLLIGPVIGPRIELSVETVGLGFSHTSKEKQWAVWSTAMEDELTRMWGKFSLLEEEKHRIMIQDKDLDRGTSKERRILFSWLYNCGKTN